MKPQRKFVIARIQKILEKLQAEYELDPDVFASIDVEQLANKFMAYYRQVDFPSKEKFDDSVYLVFEVNCHVEGLNAYEKPLLH